VGAERRRRGGAAGTPLISDAGEGDVAELRELFREYAAWIGEDFWVNDFEDELAALPGYYEALLIARLDDELVGSVAVKRLPDGAAELKRLYVRPAARGTGLGRTLAAAAVERARELGYATMRLDTLPRMEAARAIYASLGFVPGKPYADNPIQNVLWFELRL
jgi:GNAT superfamily N-acetyltransferase